MANPGREIHFWRLPRVILAYFNIQKENASSIWRIGLSKEFVTEHIRTDSTYGSVQYALPVILRFVNYKTRHPRDKRLTKSPPIGAAEHIEHNEYLSVSLISNMILLVAEEDVVVLSSQMRP